MRPSDSYVDFPRIFTEAPVSIMKLTFLLWIDAVILGKVIDGDVVERTSTENRDSLSDWERSDEGENWICLTLEPDKHA